MRFAEARACRRGRDQGLLPLVGARSSPASARCSRRSTRGRSSSRCRTSCATSTPTCSRCSGSSSATRWSRRSSCSTPAASPTWSGRARTYTVGLRVFTRRVGRSAPSRRPPTLLIAGRIVQGVGGALIMATSAALVTDAFPRRELGRALGINAMVVGAGLMLGPILGGCPHGLRLADGVLVQRPDRHRRHPPRHLRPAGAVARVGPPLVRLDRLRALPRRPRWAS